MNVNNIIPLATNTPTTTASHTANNIDVQVGNFVVSAPWLCQQDVSICINDRQINAVMIRFY
jgi:hypothetical protein